MKHTYTERQCLNPMCLKLFIPTHHRQGLCSPECIKDQKRAKWKTNAANLRARKSTGEYKSKPIRGEGVNRGTVEDWRKYFAKNPNHLATLYPKMDLVRAVGDMVKRGAFRS
jgi:hypothetical protein